MLHLHIQIRKFLCSKILIIIRIKSEFLAALFLCLVSFPLGCYQANESRSATQEGKSTPIVVE